VEPLTAHGVPGEAQTLKPAAGKGHEILLERFVAEGVGDLEVAHLTARALGVDIEPAIPSEETAGDPKMLELHVREVAEHRLLGGLGHGEIVIGSEPAFGGRLVARCTTVTTHIGRVGKLLGPCTVTPTGINHKRERHHQHDDGGGDHPDQLPTGEIIHRFLRVRAVSGHGRATCDGSKPLRVRVVPVSTLTTPFSILTGWRSRARGAGGLKTSPLRSKDEA